MIQITPQMRILTNLYEHKVAHKKTLENLYERISGESIRDGFPTYVLKKPPKIVMSGCVNVPDAVELRPKIKTLLKSLIL